MRCCVICEDINSVLDSHHTIPQSRGGVNSVQVLLCPTCHSTLHANAVHIVAKINNPTKNRKGKVFWKAGLEQNAAPFLEILVKALLTPIPEGFKREHLLTLAVDTETFELFKLLQLDLGLRSQEQTLKYCLQSKIQDYKNEKRPTEKLHMWHLHRT